MRIGWGVSLDDALVRLVGRANDATPLDPRLEKKAVETVHGLPEAQKDERARLADRHVVENIEDGQENDGRKVLMGKSGSRQAAFDYLLRLLKIPVEMALLPLAAALVRAAAHEQDHTGRRRDDTPRVKASRPS